MRPHRSAPRAGGGVPRVFVVYKKSSYEIYVRERHHARVLQLLEDGDPSVDTLLHAHERHREAMDVARKALQGLGAKAVFRYRSGPVTVDDFDLIVTLGGDGTLLWASHRVGPDCPIVAINTAPEHSVGHFCAAPAADIGDVLAEALAGRMQATRLARLAVSVDGEIVSTRVLNDMLFAHVCPASTTRLQLRLGELDAVYKSSGLWVSTAAGSTAAIRSSGGEVMPIGSRRLQFVVREPYRDPGRTDRMVTRGFIKPEQALEVVSRIRAGRLYLDGPHTGMVIDIGSRLLIRLSEEPLTLLGFRGQDA